MDSALAPPLQPAGGLRASERTRLFGLAAAIVLAAIFIRAPHFGDPAYHVDESFYLLVGQAMLAGDLPYVDIWDRKPIGLFSLYALIALLGGSGIAQYQIVAGCFAAATAILVALITRRFTGDRAALLAGIAYLAAIEQLAGGGGQAPVFYNLFTAAAALLTLRAVELPLGGKFCRFGAAAMLLAGLSITLKQTAAVEGCFFGLVLLFAVWRRTRSLAAIARLAMLFIFCGALPSAAGAAAYLLLGQWEAYWFATVASIFLKPPLPGELILTKLRYLLLCLFPLAACAGFGLSLRHWRGIGGRANETRLIAGWLAAALLGLLAVPNFFDHYALPLVLPLAVAAAPAFARGRAGLLLWLLAVGWSLATSHYPSAWGRSAALHDKAAATVRAHLHGGCLYVHDGPVQLYTATGACRVTRYVFPEHLNYALEAPAIGVDPAAEMRRILARRPRVIVTSDAPVVPPNFETAGILSDGLARNYRLVARERVLTPVRPRTLLIWVAD